MNHIYWLQPEKSVAIVARPRGDDWLEDDLRRLKIDGIDILVSLLEPDEAASLGLEFEGSLAAQCGLEFISFPIPDRTVPMDRENFRKLISYLTEAVRNGKSIGAHCRGCIGRATVTTASILISLGLKPDEALRLIEEARGCPVPDTEEQRRWILDVIPGPLSTR